MGMTQSQTLFAVIVSCLLAACTYEAAGAPRGAQGQTLEIDTTRPAPGAQGVELRAPIDVVLSEAPAAETISWKDLRLFSGRVETRGTLEVDLLERRLRLIPSERLIASLRYHVNVRGGLRGLDGSQSDEEAFVFDFTTGETLGEGPGDRPPVDEAEVEALFVRRCASCHQGASPAAAVDLSSAARAIATMAGRPSPRSGLALLRRGDHTRSYLLRKVLGSKGIVGFPMPPEGAPLSARELRLVADWIDDLEP